MDAKYEKLIERTKDGRFRPGQSGNPGGNPRSKSLSKAYKSKLEEINPDDPQKRSYAECIAASLVKLAVKGNVQAAVELADRVES
jgi:hypothetical protein